MRRLLLGATCLILSLAGVAQSPEEMLREVETLTNNGQHQDAITLLQKILERAPPNDTLLAHTYHQLGINYFRIGNDEQAIYYWEQELQWIDEPLQVARVLRNIGGSYNFLGRFGKAEKVLQKSLSIQLNNDQKEAALLGNTYRDLGYAFVEQQDWQQAIEHLQMAGSIFLQSAEPQKRLLSALYSDLFDLYWQNNNLDSALTYARQSLEMYLAVPQKTLSDTFNLANRFHNMGLAYQLLDSITQAQTYYQRSLAINRLHSSSRNGAIANDYNNLSVLYHQIEEYKKAEEFIRQAVLINEKTRDTQGLAENYHNWAEIYLSTHQLSDALEAVDQSIQYYLIPGLQGSEAPENPSLPDQSVVIGNRVQLARSGALKARILTAFATRQDSTYFPVAVSTYQMVTDLFNEIRADFGSAQSKRFFTTNARTIIEQALQTNWTAYHEYRQDTSYLNNILSLMEQSRAVSLLDALQLEQALALADIPDHLLAREKTLRQQITDLEARILDGEDSLAATLIRKRQDMKQFQEDTLMQYPRYAKLKTPQPVSLITLQQTLIDPDQAILQYFAGDSSLFCLYVDQQEVQVYHLPFSPDLPDLVVQVDSLLTDENSDVAAFDSVAQQLYSILLKQPLSHLKKKPDIHRLQIIPDGVLAKISFDVLPYETANENLSFDSYPYLLHQYAIAYAYSASVLQLQQNKYSYDSYRVGAFSVTNYQNYDRLSNLTAGDARVACSILAGDLIENSTLTKFIQQAPDYPILHLSLHASGNEQDALQSHLIFQDTILWAADIYAMELPSVMAVLGGCETGKGQLQRGEGIMSLSHAFAYAGVSSTIMSLWNLRDYTANELFKLFYEKIAYEKLPKDVALQQAKLALFKNYPQIRHPFHWSVLVSSGDQSAIPIDQTPSGLSVVLSGDTIRNAGILALTVLVIGVIAHFVRNRVNAS